MDTLRWFHWVVIIGTPMLAVGSIAIDWALWKFIWTPFSEKLRREHQLSAQRRTPVGHDTPPEGPAR